MRSLAIIILLTLACAFASTTAGDFLDNPSSVASLSRGGLAIDRSAAGFIKNPALLTLTQRSIYLAQGNALDDVQHMTLSYTHPQAYKEIGLGGSFIHAGIDGIKETTYDSLTQTATYTGKSFGYNAQAFVFGAASPLFTEHTSLGLNFKLIRESLFTESALGFGCDLGLHTSWESFEFGVSALNILQPKMRWSTGTQYSIEQMLLFSTLYNYSPELHFVADISKAEATPLSIQLGAEYTLFSFIALRGSYGQHLALGTGLYYGDLSVDYAYIDTEKNLGKTQYVSLAYNFATAKPLEKIIEPLPIKPLETTPAVKETAEIKPLPLPEPQAQVLEKVTTNKEVEIAPIEPIIENTTENTVTVSLPEKPTTPIYTYQIAVVSPRYFTSGKLQIKVFVDNTGNQPDKVTINMRILSAKGKTVQAWADESKTLNPKETGAYYFTHSAPIAPGTYYVEVKAFSSNVTRYEKSGFIVR